MAFTTPLDILNRSLQRNGQPRVTTFDDTANKAAIEAAFAYDKIRVAELQCNLWRFATKRVVLRSIGIDTVIWTPDAWVSGNSYSAGQIVSYVPTAGPYIGETIYWQTRAAKVTSTTNPYADPDYVKYTGPLAVDLYNTGTAGDATTTYQAGEIVIVPSAYSAGTTYAAQAVVRSGSVWYVSLAAGNIGNAVTNTTYWAQWTSRGRASGDFGVTASGSPIPLSYPGTGITAISLYNNNMDNPLDTTANWLALGGTTQRLNIQWPLGAGPNHDLSTKNVYHLPNGFLKKAPTDPKLNQMGSYMGAFSGTTPEDWLEEDQYIISGDSGPIMMRFIADMIDVTAMDALFCEAFNAKIAMEMTEIDTQNLPKYNRNMVAYRQAISRARSSDAIEIGPISQVENRYVTVRA